MPAHDDRLSHSPELAPPSPSFGDGARSFLIVISAAG
jgi:hypothetical protein